MTARFKFLKSNPASLEPAAALGSSQVLGTSGTSRPPGMRILLHLKTVVSLLKVTWYVLQTNLPTYIRGRVVPFPASVPNTPC